MKKKIGLPIYLPTYLLLLTFQIHMYLFLFRRDLRWQDNTGLRELWRRFNSDPDPGKRFLACYLSLSSSSFDAKYDKKILSSSFSSSLLSPASSLYVLESVLDLSGRFPYLFVHFSLSYRDHPLSSSSLSEIDLLRRCLDDLYRIEPVTALGFNREEESHPFARERDDALVKWCASRKIPCIVAPVDGDRTLLPFSLSTKEDGRPYTKFTPFRNRAWTVMADKIRAPSPSFAVHFRELDRCPAQRRWVADLCRRISFSSSSSGKPLLDMDVVSTPVLRDMIVERRQQGCLSPLVRGGRTEACRQLRRLVSLRSTYADRRNCLPYTTSLLSAPLSFGCLSIREVYRKARQVFGPRSVFESELWWREFYMTLVFHFPQLVLSSSLSSASSIDRFFFHPRWSLLKNKWNRPPYRVDHAWDRIREARTGFPVIDASLRQLYHTGWMHNRARMFVTSFMGKDLFLPPSEIEQWWARHLIDYSLPSTFGGVSWTMGYGTDALPVNRIFNPWTQSRKFDPTGKFIHSWCPELRSVPAPRLHKWNVHHSSSLVSSYPAPMVDHDRQRQLFRSLIICLHRPTFKMLIDFNF